MLRVIFSESETNTFFFEQLENEASKTQLDNKTLSLHDFKFMRILFFSNFSSRDFIRNN